MADPASNISKLIAARKVRRNSTFPVPKRGNKNEVVPDPTPTLSESEIAELRDCVGRIVEPNTLFVAGIPMNTTERELHLLFCSQEGYRFSVLKSRPFPKLSFGFVIFDNYQHADAAKNKLNGIWFNPSFDQRIRVDWAKSSIEIPPLLQDFNPIDLKRRNGVLPLFYSHLHQLRGPLNIAQPNYDLTPTAIPTSSMPIAGPSSYPNNFGANASNAPELPWPYSFAPSEYYEHCKEYTAAGLPTREPHHKQ